MTLVGRLESAWYGGASAPWWTWPLAKLYGGVTALRRALYRSNVLKRERLDVPVIVVGNISVGGTGKTPLTIAICSELSARGWRPGVVSRGHGGTQREPLLLGHTPDPVQVGDESCLIRAGGVPVAVGRDRPAAARLLLAAGCNVVIADDGLQHYRLQRDIEICVIDGVRRFGNRRLLPAGPLREPVSRLVDVDFRVCNGDTADADEFAMTLRGGDVVNLLDGRTQRLEDFVGQSVHAVAAIGHPKRFFDSLRAAGIEPVEHTFVDHHAFVASDLDFADDLPVWMTDKDAVKCRRFAKSNWWRVPVRAELSSSFHDAVAARLQALRII
ncbi:tetraacyldisaccharide 4'-kinase [Rhodanobacter sp. L36]|uniref:tetraacyldisaccharide 4'-kinase n=1 Tax=Rhodanobacter sp. L36 TaxID=1747221 RepID=UPI00131B78A3|nr:tetraacyldisaccharide 4'-kinase [Rhodanobacter sp. L36]